MNNFFEFKNITETSSDLYIYGDIISDEEEKIYDSDVTVKGFKEGLDSVSKDSTLNIFINSGGGSVFAAVSMVNMLTRAKEAKNLKVIAHIDGLAASAASLFPFAADETIVYKNSILMIHKPTVVFFAVVNSTDLRHEADVLDKIQSSVLLTTYMSKVKDGTTVVQMNHLIDNETWMSADEIVEKFEGFKLVEAKMNVKNCTSKFFDNYKHVPDRFREEHKEEPEIKDEVEPEEVPEETSTEESKIDTAEQGSDVEPAVDDHSDDSTLAKFKIMQMKKEND